MAHLPMHHVKDAADYGAPLQFIEIAVVRMHCGILSSLRSLAATGDSHGHE